MLTNKQIESLNELETKIFSYIIDNGEKILKMKIQDIASKTHVSTTTILRFCKKAGCNGFSEFRIKYKLYLESSESKNNIAYTDYSSILNYFYNNNTSSFISKINKVSETILSKENLLLIGFGRDGILAKYSRNILGTIKPNCSYIDDPFLSVPNKDFSHTAIIVISINKYSDSTIKHIIKYKEKGAYIISITNNEECSICRYSDDNFSHYIVEENYNDYNLTSHIPTMFVLEMLCRKIISDQNPNNRGDNHEIK